MLHFENIPSWSLFVLGAIFLLVAGTWCFERFRFKRFERDEQRYRARNKGEEMAWHLRWRPRPRRLTYHPPKDDQSG